MEVSQKYHKIPIFVFFLFRKIGAKVESGKVSSDYKNSTILFIVSIKIGTKNKECLLFQFYIIESVYLSSL